jgi:hypothetical protein
MLHVPSSLLYGRELDDALLRRLGRDYHAPAHVTNVLRGKRFGYPGDLLDDPEIRGTISPIELLKLLVPPRYDKPIVPSRPVRAVRAMPVDRSGIVVEVWEIEDDRYRLALSSESVEVISIEVAKGNTLDAGTLRIGGFWFWEWPKLSRETRARIYQIVTQPRVQEGMLRLSRLDPAAQPRLDSLTPPVRKVAQLVLFFASATGTGADALAGTVVGGRPGTDDLYDPGGMTQEEYPPSDNCSLSPDFPFAKCCVAHDYCYLETPLGCDECARLQCDLDFLNCMLSVAGLNPELQKLAVVYFLAVRAFGDVGDGTFQFCGSASSSGGFNLNKLLLLGALGLGAGLGVIVGSDAGLFPGIAVGALAFAASVALLGKLLCELCGQLEEWIEECEADRVEREERCKRRKKKCKKKRHWWQKVFCYIRYFWDCWIWYYIRKGLCWLVKKAHPIVC